jgi:hypothetical protein
MSKPILCLDFDGVIHSYSSGWKGADVIPDPPVPGAVAFICNALPHFRVAIYSSRSGQSGGIDAMQAWLHTAMVTEGVYPPETADNLLGQIEWPTEKPPAMVTIDDRALTFTGSWPDTEELLAFQPWNKKREQLGATGEFPKGRLNDGDEGALKVAVGTENGVVKIDFGKRIAWIGLPKREAVAWASVILKHAESLPDVQ